jgi:histidinol dehydrogenase
MYTSEISSDNLNKLKATTARFSDQHIKDYQKSVEEIISNIKSNGDKALAEYSLKFDNFKIDLACDKPFNIKLDLINKPNLNNLSPEIKAALLNAKARIEKFHEEEYNNSKFAKGWSYTGPLNEKLGVKYDPLGAVAVYVPGGKAPLVSTVLMTVIPAKTAGVKRIVLVSPPPISTGILAAAELLEIEEIVQAGGAQAVAAVAHGTQSIKAVDKIVGPGNIYVSLAKKIVFGKIGIDGIYGPSELAILADAFAKPKQIAADLLSQLEHGSGLESVLLVSTDTKLNSQVYDYIYQELEDLLAQKLKTEKQIETIKSSLNQHSALLVAKDLKEAIAIINYYAPEHLELCVNNARDLIPEFKTAGAIFVGNNSCESLGDYLAGPSHCLPTSGSARFSSGLQCHDFVRKTSIIDFSESTELESISKDVALIARLEELEMHARAMEYRKNG